jgi:D-alanyl-D-alanine carboxypeptidase/D-alanyl-D-alanine-endopeptidase (penicillin-binding protein 4)
MNRLVVSTAVALLITATPVGAEPAAPSPEVLARTHKGIEQGIRRAFQDPCLQSARVGVLVLDLVSGEEVFANRANEAFTPASNMKILTAAAALDRLRPETVFRTSVTTMAPVQDGVVKGDVYLVGGGDPGLVPESLFLLAMRLQSQGITRIEGDLVGDDTLFDSMSRPAGWPQRNFHRAFSAPFSALTVNYSAVGVRTVPTVPQNKVQVVVEPFADFFDVENRGVTSNRTRSIQISRTFRNGRNVIRVSGYQPRGGGETSVVRSVENPTFYTLTGFRTLLRQQGIEVTGSLRSGPAPEKARELTHYESRPLFQLVLDLNKYSSNVMAEMLLKTLAVQQNGAPTDNLRILDGSGLTEDSLLTPRVLVAALDRTWEDFEIRPEFWASLPVGGTDGTLRKRLQGIGRRVRAKTGLVRGAVTLSGFAYGPDDRPYAFSILVNDAKCAAWKVQKGIDKIVLAVTGNGV